eukprot:CAMPEP_0177721622 /NCGR_PEP_ID=MMETSP0484_2-20121128/17246_1 /TAXON_ID=354590 /ORGANISM="Rhodomonas lens, Strain RHODO" /LENGTH=401 /DNA_ID=CAMNT_0019233941 /DNA_START=19 /DNA_END=1220 /DNA_ORIENTATION=+
MAPANFSLLLFVLSIIDVAVIFAAPVPAFASKGPVVLTQTAELARGSSLKLTMSGAGRSKEGKMNNMQSPSLYRMYKVASIKPSYLESMSTLSPAEYYLGRSASNESEKPQDMPLKSVNKMVNDELSKETKPVKKISSEKPNASRAPLDRKTVVGGALALAAVAILDRKFHSEPEEAEVEIAEEPKGGLFAWRSRGQQEEEPEEDGNKVLAATMQVGGAALNTAKVVASTTWTVGKVTAQAAWMAASGLMMVGKFVSQTVEATAPVVNVLGEEVVKPFVDRTAPVLTEQVNSGMQQAAPYLRPAVEGVSSSLSQAQNAINGMASSSSAEASKSIAPLVSSFQNSPLVDSARKTSESLSPVVQSGWTAAAPVLGQGLRTAGGMALGGLSFIGHVIGTAANSG